jgi:hypothetical protein
MIHRRTALGMMGAAVGLAAANPVLARSAKRGAPQLDLDDPKQLALAFRKMAYSLDDSVTFWWMRGTRYGVVDSVATPFWDMWVGTWFKTRDLDDNSYEVIMASANFYTPPNSTELLEVFRNPYTGEEVPVKYAPPRAWRTEVGREGGSAFGSNMPGMRTIARSDAAGPGWIEGDDVAIRGDMVISAEPIDPSSGAKRLQVQDWSTYVSSLAHVADPKVKNAQCVQYFNDILTWPAWLQMGDQPGSYVSRCFGRKAFAYEQMPRVWRQLFERVQPEAAKNPAAVLSVK